MAKKTPTGTAMRSYDDELAKLAAQATEAEADVGSGISYIRTRGGQMEYEGNRIQDNKLNCIILDHVLINEYYAERYDPDSPAPPTCFAIGRDAAEMAPHDNSLEKQNDICATCPMNEFGSSDTGRGKACKNSRRLILLPEDAVDDPDGALPAMIKVPVTSVKAWANYVRQLSASLKRPTLGVVTEISLHPDPKTQFKMSFRMISVIEDSDTIKVLLDRRTALQSALEMPYAPQEDAEDAPAPVPARKGKGAGRAAQATPRARSKVSRR